MYLTKLSCTARLLSVTIVGLCSFGDCLTIWNLWRVEGGRDLIYIIKMPFHYIKVIFTLTMNNDLL